MIGMGEICFRCGEERTEVAAIACYGVARELDCKGWARV